MISTIIDFILHIDQHLAALSAEYGVWIYGILFLIIFCETGLVVMPLLPGDSLLFAAGSIAAIGKMNIHLMVVLLIIAAILGDAVNFMIGKYFGEKLFANPNSKIFKRSHLQKTQQFYAKHGGKTIILARFIPIVRTFAPFMAGVGNMNYVRFFTYNVVGAAMWVLICCLAGYFFGNFDWVQRHLDKIIWALILVPGLLAIGGAWRASRAERAAGAR